MVPGYYFQIHLSICIKKGSIDSGEWVEVGKEMKKMIVNYAIFLLFLLILVQGAQAEETYEVVPFIPGSDSSDGYIVTDISVDNNGNIYIIQPEPIERIIKFLSDGAYASDKNIRDTFDPELEPIRVEMSSMSILMRPQIIFWNILLQERISRKWMSIQQNRV